MAINVYAFVCTQCSVYSTSVYIDTLSRMTAHCLHGCCAPSVFRVWKQNFFICHKLCACAFAKRCAIVESVCFDYINRNTQIYAYMSHSVHCVSVVYLLSLTITEREWHSPFQTTEYSECFVVAGISLWLSSCSVYCTPEWIWYRYELYDLFLVIWRLKLSRFMWWHIDTCYTHIDTDIDGKGRGGGRLG